MSSSRPEDKHVATFPYYNMTVYSWTVLFIMCSRAIFCFYRAITQAITVDEAFTFNRFIDGNWWSVVGPYDANNHILYTIITRTVTGLLGVSELTMRLSSVLAGIGLMFAVAELVKLASVPALRILALFCVALHPPLLDFSVAARGYSLSIALLLWGIIVMLRGLPVRSSLLFGLAGSANLGVAFAVMGAIGASLLLHCDCTKSKCKTTISLTLPGLLLFLLLSLWPLSSMTSSTFYVGYPSASDAIRNFIYTSIHARVDNEGFWNPAEAVEIIVKWLLPITLVMFGVIIATDRLWRFRETRRSLIPLATLVLALLGILASHTLSGMVYPPERACLWVVPLFAITWAILMSLARFWILVPQIALMVLLLAQFRTQLHASYFQFWWEHANNRRAIELVREITSTCPAKSVSISVSPVYIEPFEFYRKILQIKSLRTIDGTEPPIWVGNDFYALTGGSREILAHKGFEVLIDDPGADFMLAQNTNHVADVANCLSGR